MTDQDTTAAGESGWYTDENSTFGDRLAAAREAAGLSQADLARRAGVGLASVKAWENDQSEPRANTLQRVAGILGVSLMWLMAGEGDGIVGAENLGGLPDEVGALLGEMRALRADHARIGEKLGRLEKRLRLAVLAREDA
ncbi:helix-turn-helix domain-containing protein [Rhodobacterales bacterium HKCCE3408]|nr:helix-turn-helix domain-containing protein [Rhodobacterales bacterium HKCCE3408]